MKRILMLHGFAQNGTIFYKRMSALRKAAGKHCDFVFLDGPIVLQPADLPMGFASFDRPESVDTEADPELTPRAWWRSNEEKTVYHGLDETLIYVRDFLKKQAAEKGPFDPRCRNGSIADCNTRATDSLYASSFIDLQTQQTVHPPFQRAIFVSGFRPTAKKITHLFVDSGQKILGTQTKILCVMGRMDTLIPMKRMRTLVDCCIEENLRVEEHDGAHFVPSQSNWRAFFSNYISADDVNLVPSPSAGMNGMGYPNEGLDVSHQL